MKKYKFISEIIKHKGVHFITREFLEKRYVVKYIY